MENDGNWHMASSRGKGGKSRQPIKNGDIRQNGVYDNAKITNNGNNKESGSNGSSGGAMATQNNNNVQRNSIYKTHQTVHKPPTMTSTTNHQSSGSTVNGFNSDPKKSLDKEIRSLARHEASIERARWLFNEEMIKSEDRLKRAFSELKILLNQREQNLLTELNLCKTEGTLMINNKDEICRQLKIQVERAAKMSDKELGEIRQNIRKFVNEKKLDDDIGKTLRFQYEPDKLIDLINNFGEVIHVNQPPRKSSSLNSLISADDAASAASSDAGKALNQVMIGGLLIQSDSMDTSQLADLTRQLQESLKMQGITDDIIPEVSGSSGSMPQRRRPAQGSAAPSPSARGGGGGSRRGGSNSSSRR